MKKIRVFAVMMLCLTLLAFAGCGDDNADENVDDGTVVEETVDDNDNGDINDTEDGTVNKGDSVGEDMVDDASQAIDDMGRDLDGNGNNRVNDTNNRN